MTKVLEVFNLQKYYGSKGNLTKALDDVSFSVESGEFVGIMGASGSGKTTLLNCVSTIDVVSTGKILLDGKNITNLRGEALNDFRRDELGFIFQEFNLLDTMTAFENIALALSIQKVPAPTIKEKVEQVAAKLGITEVLDKYPYQMSGGQKQRVACARAVVTDPKLILADGPTGALDSKSSRMLLESLMTLNTGLGSTIMMVTHDALSASYASRILFIKDGKLFTELRREEGEERKAFYGRIVQVQSLLGGDAEELAE
ncbi:MAG: ABC transporter ATP-binding protein [Lachnospiraceae bacterium]|nr:ABC transporter ATP-binding protein [Lachnospiraceae bacterium]